MPFGRPAKRADKSFEIAATRHREESTAAGRLAAVGMHHPLWRQYHGTRPDHQAPAIDLKSKFALKHVKKFVL